MAQDRDDEREGKLAGDLIETGGDIAGAAVGGALGTLGGPAGIAAGAVGGVAITRLVKRLGAEIQDRVLGPRQRVRAGAALAVAVERINERIEEGETLRADGFFDADDSGRAPGDELLEGVLLDAANAYQERKVPHIGSLFASLAFRSDVSPAYGHYLIRLADRLTYRQLAALAYFGEHAGSDELIYLHAEREEEGRQPFADALSPELEELGGELGLLGIAQADGTVVRADRTFGGGNIERHELGTLALTSLGRELYELMELSRVSATAKREIFDLMAQPTRGNPGATQDP